MKQIFKNSKFVYIIIIGILLFGVIMSILYSVPVISKGIVFSLYTILGMLLPGFALVNLLDIECRSDVELTAYVVFFGYLLSFLQYFLVVPFGIQDYAPLVWLAVSFFSFLYLYKKNKLDSLVVCKDNDNLGMWGCVFFCVVVIFIKCGLYAGLNLLPFDKVQKTGIHEDLLYWMGNTVELTKRFPPFDFRNYGNAYNYHYFTNIQLAMTSLATGINTWLISLCYSYIYPSAMLVFGGYVAFSKCTDKDWLRQAGMLAFLFTSGFSDVTDNRYAGYMYEYPFAFDYGMAIFLFLSFLVMKEFYKEKFFRNNLCVIVAFFALLCGVKANFGAIALIGIGMVCFRWFLNKNQRNKAVLLGSITLTIFVVIYVLVTNLKGYIGGASSEFMVSNLLTNGGNYGDGMLASLYEKMLLMNVWAPLAAVLVAFIYVILSNPLVFGLMIYQISVTVKKREKLADGSFCLMSMVLTGSFICSFIGMGGWSERYFMYNTFPVGIMFVLLNWKFIYEDDDLCKLKSAVIIILFIVSWYGMVKYDGRMALIEDVKNGYARYMGSEYYVDYQNVLTKKQLEAYEWLGKNAKREDLIVTNHDRSVKGNVVLDRCNLIDVFTELNIIDVTNEKYDALWGIYVKQDGGKLDQYFERELNFTKVFENEEVEIYGK